MTTSLKPSSLDQDSTSLERRGRRWLIWSFVVCPCHLPVTMAVLGTLFGGTAFGALVSRNTMAVGLVFGALYLGGLVVAFGYLRRATARADCSDGSCTVG